MDPRLTPDEYKVLFGELNPTLDPAAESAHTEPASAVATLSPPPIPNLLPVLATPPPAAPGNRRDPAGTWQWALGGALAGSLIALLLSVLIIKPSRSDTPDTLVAANTLTAAITSQSMEGADIVDADISLARTQLGDATILPRLVADTPYSRGLYRIGGWPDTDDDCQNNRTEVLIAEATGPLELRSDNCAVLTGEWTDPFAGTILTHPNTTAINHLVPLAEAHRAGAWEWSDDKRAAFAADLEPETLVVVSTPMDQGKADRRPEQWRPPLRSAWCGYAIDWITIKTRWELAFLQAEVDALNDMLDTCVT